MKINNRLISEPTSSSRVHSGDSLVGRDREADDIAEQDIIYAGKDKNYPIQGLKDRWEALARNSFVATSALFTLMGLVGAILIGTIPTVFIVAAEIVLGIAVIFYISKIYLKKLDENNKRIVDELRNVESVFFHELEIKTTSLIEENRLK